MIRHDDRGSAALEFVLMSPVFLVLAFWFAAAAQFPQGRSEAFNAAYIAAREASMARSPDEAKQRAYTSLAANLSEGACREFTADVDTTKFEPTIDRNGVSPGHIVVSVTCVLDTRGLGRVGRDESVVRARAVGTVDAFRGQR